MKKTVVILYIVVVAVMAAATIIESYHGTEYVAQNIYGAWWFSALWALLAAATIFWFVKRRVRRPSVVALHLSFIVILAGALLTHLTAVRGVVPLRKGIPDNQYLTSDMRLHQLPFTLRLDDFEIKYYEGSNDPSDYISHVTIDDQPVTISMNHIATRSGIRLYQMDYDPDLQGSILAMNSDPWGIPVTYAGYALLFVSLLWMLLDPKGGFRNQLSTLRGRRYWLLAVLLLAVYALLLYHFLGKYSAANHPLPVLNSWLLPVHVSTIIMAYLLLFVAIFVRAMLYPALAFLSYGIFIGAIWANQSWGNYWSWDPKETWALITLMVYAVPLHGSLFRSARNLQFSARRAKRDACHPLELVRLPEQERDARIFNFQSSIKLYRLYMSLAFLVILMTYLGVNYLLGGMHSYA